jgi:membrane protein required for beta-lactamase induction
MLFKCGKLSSLSANDLFLDRATRRRMNPLLWRVLLARSETLKEESWIAMFLILAIVLVVLWLGGFTLMHVSSLFIHLLLLFAVISLILHFVTGRRTV